MSLFRRAPADDAGPEIHVGNTGVIYEGRQIGGPHEGLNEIVSGRRGSAANIKLCEKFWPRARIEDFGDLPDGGWYDRASGLVYDAVQSDPLLSPGDPRSLASAFTIGHNGMVVFLSARAGVTVGDLEREQEERAAELERTEAARAKRRNREPQVAFRLSEARGEAITVREAARRLLDSGGRIARGELGELVLTAPGRLTGDPVTEAIARRELAAAAEVLAAARLVVLGALEQDANGGSKLRLDERLPDREVAIGGGVA